MPAKKATATPTRRGRHTLTPEQRAERIAEARGRLDAGIDALMSGEGWRQMIESRRWLRKYSLSNVLLILQQVPEATDVRPLSVWNAAGHRVRKGSTGIRIWAPGSRRRADATEVEDNPEPTESSNAEAGTAPRGPRFILVSVFDVSQLETRPEKLADPAELRGAAPEGLWDSVAALVREAGYSVERGPCGNAFGMTSYTARTVRVRADVDPAQAVKTLCHELAHILCGHETRTGSRSLQEVEAESVACIVTSMFGLDTVGYSVPYVAGWAADRDMVRASAERVLGVADGILGAPAPMASASRVA